MLLPLFGDDEQEWAPALRGFLYGVGMLWFFLGVAIVADLFMGGIEQICTATTVKEGKDGKRHVYRKWNPTVANLSLMALGSSAPEILLNVMEILLNDFKAGALGPSTIVGSAAFNLLVIIAVCVISISAKDGDSGLRKITGIKVYAITASTSVFAYLWLLVILVYNTKDVVDAYEAALTFVFFWILLVAAYVADKNCFRPVDEEAAAMEEEERNQIAMQKMASLKEAGLDDHKAGRVLQDLLKPTTAATYSRATMGLLTGKKKRAMIAPNGKAVNTGTTTMNLHKAASAKVAPAQNKVEDLASVSTKAACLVKFKQEEFKVKEECGSVELIVVRSGSLDQACHVEYSTQDASAIAGKDYKETSGTLKFAAGQDEATFKVEIIDDDKFEHDEMFRVLLKDPSPQCKVSKEGGDIAQVVIISEDKLEKGRSALMAKLTNEDKMDFILEEWKQQFADAIRPATGDDGRSSPLAMVMHVVTVFWKVLFATVPPPALWGGWGAFGVALGYIGLMTVLVGDLCALFGCMLGLKAEVTAITFVALGTSMPDLFASKAAAVAEPDADNSVGNVTGSNCVNVFLGLGLPWLIASVYWEAQGEKFIVCSGALALSVTVFCCCSVSCLAILYLRRVMFGGELGGPAGPKYLTALFFGALWFLYVIVSSLKTYEIM